VAFLLVTYRKGKGIRQTGAYMFTDFPQEMKQYPSKHEFGLQVTYHKCNSTHQTEVWGFYRLVSRSLISFYKFFAGSVEQNT